MLETHIVVSLSIFCLILILMFCLAFTLVLLLSPSHVLCLTLLLVLYLSSLMDSTITHMVLVHERTALSLDALVTIHVLIMVTVSCVGLIFLLEGHFPTMSRDTFGRMVKCWIPKIYLTNPSTEPSNFSRPM
jgi:hypothetical protein